ncbi:MAG: ABC transporter permease [Alphaproteobacteria bacterium]|nr:ABC transporter permease [Alphaproteobacteria bacterium]
MTEALQRFGYAGVGAILFGVLFWGALLIVAPMLLMVDLAFRPYLPNPKDVGGPLDVYTIQNFAKVFLDPLNVWVFWKTIYASILVTVVSLLIGYPLSYILVRAGRSAWIGILMIGLLIPFWVNEILRTFAWQLLLARYGFINTVLMGLGLIDDPIQFTNTDFGVQVGLVYAYILFMIFPLYSTMESLDPNQVDAARDLGAPFWRIHWDIVVPHSKPGIASGCIVTFMLSAGSYVVPELLGGTRSIWFTKLIYLQFDAINWNLGSAYGFTLVSLCLVFILLVMAMFRVSLKDIAR